MFSSPFSEPMQESGSIEIAGTSRPLCSDQTVANFAIILATFCENVLVMPIEMSP